MDFLNQHKTIKRLLFITLVAVFLVGTSLFLHPVRRTVRVTIQTALAHTSQPASEAFPMMETSNLATVQKKILALNKEQYAKKPVSYDVNVLTYTQGSKEAWCADYASWIMKRAGVPFNNPNSGSWRIPGVYTLKEYFQKSHRYEPVGAYKPKLGDVAIYSHGQGHTAIVLKTEGNSIVTIGGNESGRLRIDIRPQTGARSYDLIGYGTLSE